MPIIGKMLGEVKYYKIREKLIIGCDEKANSLQYCN